MRLEIEGEKYNVPDLRSCKLDDVHDLRSYTLDDEHMNWGHAE